jgi:hypothetical protein
VRRSDARAALQSIWSSCSPWFVAATHGVRSEFAARSEFLVRRRIAGYWFREPTMPFAISSAAWFFVAGLRRSQLSDGCALSASSAFLQRIAQLVLVRRPRPANASHGL